MSEEQQQLSLNTWAENKAKVQDGTRLDPEHGTFTLSTNTVKGALEITRAAFGLVALDQRYETHLNWLVGDLLWNGSERFGDKFDQDFDGFATMVGWSRRRLIQREKTSRLFGDVKLRVYSYDVAQWQEFFPEQVESGIDGVMLPLGWVHYREAGLVAGIDLSDLMTAIKIGWFIRLNPRDIRNLVTAAYGIHGDKMSEYLEDVLESAAESCQIAVEKIGLLHDQANEKDPKGRYILITARAKDKVEFDRVSELSPARYESSDLVLKFGGTNGLSEVVQYDGITEELQHVEGSV